MGQRRDLRLYHFNSDFVKWLCAIALIAAYGISEGVHIKYISIFLFWILTTGYVIAETSKIKLRQYFYAVQLTVLVLAIAGNSTLSVLLLIIPVFVVLITSADKNVLYIPAIPSIIFFIFFRNDESILSLTSWIIVLVTSWYITTILSSVVAALNEKTFQSDHLQSNTSLHHTFVMELANGKFPEKNIFDKKDLLGNALFDMGLKIKTSYDRERIRNWEMTGLNEVSSKLRSVQNHDASFNDVLSYLVKYMNANQGGLFTINKDNPADVFLEMKSCYAYERQKMIVQRFSITNGLLGQCIAEREMVYVEKIPPNYVRITSGLGLSTPSSLIIVPLRDNDGVYGAMEIASFSTIKKYEQEFLMRAGEIIGSAISSLQRNTYTSKMLHESQELAEELKSQQEEIKQNLEELEATQEHLTREAKEREKLQEQLKKSSEFLNLILDSVPIPVFVKDRKHRMVLLNKAVSDLNNMTREEMLGKTDYDFFSKDEADVFWNFEERIFVKKSSEEKIEHAIRNGKETYTLDKKLAVRTDDGEEFLIGINIDVTDSEMIKRQSAHQHH